MRYLLILMALAMLCSCDRIDQTTSELNQKLSTEEKIDCNQLALDRIPQNITLHYSAGYGGWGTEDFTFADGNEAEKFVVVNYREGQHSGENVNYFYQNDFYTYSNRVVDQEGFILGTLNFQAKLVLEPIDESLREESYKAATYKLKTKDFAVVDVHLVNCSI